ncbi:MAG: hypothetical protein AABY15_06395 [Nanoarchaeota archaeon]
MEYAGKSFTLKELPQLRFDTPVLTIGKKYKVLEVDGSNFVICDDKGEKTSIGSCRFIFSKQEWIKFTLGRLHHQEDEYNKEIGEIDGQIVELNKKKKAIAAKISRNMKHRNYLINML